MGKRIAGKRKWIVAVLASMMLTAAGISGSAMEDETSVQALETGSYEVPEGWSEDTAASTEDASTYRRTENLALEETSTITCSYIATNYAVTEYEQLRDMLTNDLLYSRVNAQISSTCGYTEQKDNLFILTADDASLDYREICCYVVADMECFVVEIKEYRAEAAGAAAAGEQTPEEAGRRLAEAFTW